MKSYEMVAILDPGLDPAVCAEKSKDLEGRIKTHGGEVQNIVQWGKRKLAYNILKKDAGYYLVFNFQTTSKGLLDFKESIKHDLEILRYLIIVEPKAKFSPFRPPGEGDEEAGARFGGRGRARSFRRERDDDEMREEER